LKVLISARTPLRTRGAIISFSGRDLINEKAKRTRTATAPNASIPFAITRDVTDAFEPTGMWFWPNAAQDLRSGCNNTAPIVDLLFASWQQAAKRLRRKSMRHAFVGCAIAP
jgi:hypothetical protein